MIAMFKWLDGTWDQVKGQLRLDLEHLESAINQRHGATFNDDNTLKVDTVAGDASEDTRYISNEGTNHSPLWALVNLAIGVKNRLKFENLTAATNTKKLLGRGSASTGDFQELTPGAGLDIVGTQLVATGSASTLAAPNSGLFPLDGEDAETPIGLPLSSFGGVKRTGAVAAVGNLVVFADANGDTVRDGGSPASPAGGYLISSNGNPQGVTSAAVGTEYIDTVTGYHYGKAVGSGNTGWYYLPNRGAGLVNSLPHWSIRATEDWASTVVGACDGIDGHTSYAGASTSTSRQADDLYTQFASSTTAGNNGGTFAPNGFAVSRMKWAMDFDFVTKILTDSTLTNVRIFVGLSDTDPTNSDTWGGRTIGFTYRAGTDTQWVGLSNDNTTQSVTANIAAIAVSTVYILRIRYVSGVAYFSVNDGAETSKATNIPTGASIPYWLWSANNSAGGVGSSRSLYVARSGCTYGTI